MPRTHQQIEKLIAENMGLVHSESMRWGEGMDEDERIAAGLRGLARACKTWDHEKGKLSTFASWWIRAECSRVRKRDRSHSLERPASDCVVRGKKHNKTIIELMACPATQRPSESSERADVRAQVDRLLAAIPEYQSQVICWRFGIGCDPLRPDDIGNRMGVSRTTINNWVEEGLASLRRAVAWMGVECAA